jgi:uncharacterized protein YndB with AHSA1/START domain
MEANRKINISIDTNVNASIGKIWQFWTEPRHIMQWNAASDDWHTTKAENDLEVGGKFSSRMEAKDGSFGFDFFGIYDAVKINELIAYTLGDGRKVTISFSAEGNAIKMVIVFEAETQNPIEVQKGGWQAILNNFKKYTESN